MDKLAGKMSGERTEVVGSSCGQHGAYVFYKAFGFTRNGRRRILALGEFFFVQLRADQPTVCLCELQLLYRDRSDDRLLAYVRLYFLPENTPDGRLEEHGEDEVLAMQDKQTLQLEDLASVVVSGHRWQSGRHTGSAHDPSAPPGVFRSSRTNTRLDLDDVELAKRALGDTVGPDEPCALVLGYNQYCRVRGLLKRLETVSSRVYVHKMIRALGGFHVPSRNTRLLYCRDFFDSPDLEGHELFCSHLAPKLRGRTRKKARKRGCSPGSESTSDTESARPDPLPAATPTCRTVGNGVLHKPVPGLTPAGKPFHQLRSSRCDSDTFLLRLQLFLKQRGTPLSRPAICNNKTVDLHMLYRRVQEQGGYQAVCVKRGWHHLCGQMGGDQNSPAAVNGIRRCYERVCLSFERHERGIVTPAPTPTQAAAAVGEPRPPPAERPDAATLALLAHARPAITITPIPRATSAPPPQYTALQRLASMARQTDAQRARPEPPPAHQVARRAAPPAAGVDLTAAARVGEPTRIGSITITPVEKAAPVPAAGPGEHLLALRMASAALPPQMLHYMGLVPGAGKAVGLEQLRQLQQQMALQQLMVQRLVAMPAGLSSEQTQASLEAYQRLMQGRLRRS